MQSWGERLPPQASNRKNVLCRCEGERKDTSQGGGSNAVNGVNKHAGGLAAMQPNAARGDWSCLPSDGCSVRDAKYPSPVRRHKLRPTVVHFERLQALQALYNPLLEGRPVLPGGRRPDPLCCWSWALEPQWRRLRYEYGRQIRWRYRMAGMIAGWDGYDDPLMSLSRSAQMGPVWLQARHLSGMPTKDQVWTEDPPSSSYPACHVNDVRSSQSRRVARRRCKISRRCLASTDALLSVRRAPIPPCHRVRA